MKKTYKFKYDDAKVVFIVDEEKFTEEMAKKSLNLLGYRARRGSYTEDLLSKYTMEILKELDLFSLIGMIKYISNKEGFYSIDGSSGIELVQLYEFEFDENKLEVEVFEI